MKYLSMKHGSLFLVGIIGFVVINGCAGSKNQVVSLELTGKRSNQLNAI